MLDLVLPNGLITIVSQLTLVPQTAFFRQLIWEYGVKSVVEHPWFGIGFTSYSRLDWMGPSVDNHWLLIAIRFGALPAILSIVVIIAALVRLAISTRGLEETERKMRVAIAASLLIVFILGFTVSFFGGVQAWFYMLIGLAISIPILSRRHKQPLIRQPMPDKSRRRLTA